MKILALIARILMGLAFLFFGVHGFVHFKFIPMQFPPGHAGDFLKLLVFSRYGYAIAAIEIMSALFFLTGRYVRLGLLMLGPILVNILLFHISFDPTHIAGGLIFSALWWIVFLDDKAFKREVFASRPAA
jgi:putative oxidoreductase